MVCVNCPKCGRGLLIPDTDQKVCLRCPDCRATFLACAPGARRRRPSRRRRAAAGTFPKVLLATLTALGVGVALFLAHETVRDVRAQEIWERAGLGAKSSERTVAWRAPMSPRQLYAKASPAVVRIVVHDGQFRPIGLGSGFFVSKDGLVVTNHHVIGGAHFASVSLADGTTFHIDSVLATEPGADLALLKLNGADVAHLDILRGQIPRVGTEVFAIGNPEGMTNVFSKGLISGLWTGRAGPMFIETTAWMSAGSSGGPLLRADGNVVGVAARRLSGARNLYFAVPSTDVHRLLLKRRKSRALGGPGGRRLDKAATEQLREAWLAMVEKDWARHHEATHQATRHLAGLREDQEGHIFLRLSIGRAR